LRKREKKRKKEVVSLREKEKYPHEFTVNHSIRPQKRSFPISFERKLQPEKAGEGN